MNVVEKLRQNDPDTTHISIMLRYEKSQAYTKLLPLNVIKKSLLL